MLSQFDHNIIATLIRRNSLSLPRATHCTHARQFWSYFCDFVPSQQFVFAHATHAQHARRDEFDHIIIETTGLANPAPIISSFYMDKDLPDKWVCSLVFGHQD
jgi:hypothetical protein